MAAKSVCLGTGEAESKGHTLVYVAVDGDYTGAIELRPKVRPEARQIVDRLAERGMELMILTGDEEEPTRWLAGELGIDTWFSRTLPEQKDRRIAELRDSGRRVCFIGDGVNDVLAMAQADVSLSISGASALAVESAQIILRDGSLERLDDVFEMGERYRAAQKRLLTAAVAPSVVSGGSVIVAGIPIVAVVGIYGAGLLASMGLVYLYQPMGPSGEER